MWLVGVQRRIPKLASPGYDDHVHVKIKSGAPDAATPRFHLTHRRTIEETVRVVIIPRTAGGERRSLRYRVVDQSLSETIVDMVSRLRTLWHARTASRTTD